MPQLALCLDQEIGIPIQRGRIPDVLGKSVAAERTQRRFDVREQPGCGVIGAIGCIGIGLIVDIARRSQPKVRRMTLQSGQKPFRTLQIVAQRQRVGGRRGRKISDLADVLLEFRAFDLGGREVTSLIDRLGQRLRPGGHADEPERESPHCFHHSPQA